MPPDKDADNAALLEAEIDHLKSDVIGLQEVDYFLSRSGSHNQVGNVATMMSAAHWAYKRGGIARIWHRNGFQNSSCVMASFRFEGLSCRRADDISC